MLRRKVVKEILSAIDSSKFSRDDFEISDALAEVDSFSIHCLVDSSFHFLITNRNDNDTVLIERCPGTIKRTDTLAIKSNAIPKFVSAWLVDAYEDILSSHEDSTAFIAMKEALLRDIEESQTHFGSEHFSVEEVIDFKNRLEKLEETITSLQEKLNFSEASISDIKEDISSMEEVLTKLPKSSWLKFSSNKMIKWFRKSVTSDDIGKAIGSAVKEMISA